MPKFQYTAVNSSGSTLHGVVEADDLRAAKKELNNLDLQVVDLKEVDLKTKLLKSSLNKYKFEATNADGKVVKGTIAALDEGKALGRLQSEYKLTVSKISHLNASNKSFEDSSSKVDELSSKKPKIDESRVKALRKLLIPIIDDLKSLMKHVVDDLGDQISQQTKEFLDKYYLHLDKIKYSDNLGNVQSVCLKICHVLETSEVFFENDQKVEVKLRANLMARNLEKRFKNYDVPPSKRNGLMVNARMDSVWSLIAIVFQSKSSSQRKLAIRDLLGKIKGLFSFNASELASLSKIVKELSLWLLALYSLIYLVGHFLSVKNLKFPAPAILEIYSTNILIYLVVGVLLLHLGIEIVERISKNRLLKFAVSSMFLLLYIMICINL
jgi:hypothetical protein